MRTDALGILWGLSSHPFVPSKYSNVLCMMLSESFCECYAYNQIMQGDVSAIQLMGLLMSRSSLEMENALELVQILNRSYFQCQRVVTILEDVFTREKSAKILLGVEIMEFLIKNCTKNFHQAANKESFQKKVLSLLKRLRGKSNFLKDLRSNGDNWNKIQAKVLYLVQLWYDAFILEESVYNNIIDNYKTLRKQGVLFPPRSANEKNLIFVKTESPILQNIQEIARADQQKFGKQLGNLGLGEAFKKIQKFQAEQNKRRQSHHIDLDNISEKIAIVRSNSYEGDQMIYLVNDIKKDLEFGRVDPSEQKYWKDIKEAAESLIEEWEQKNAELIAQHERRYSEMKMGKAHSSERQKPQHSEPRHQEIKEEKPVAVKQEINLLDL